MALGVELRALARRPFLLGGQIAIAGVALGIPVGLAADAWLAGVMDQFFPLPVVRASFQADLYLQGACSGCAAAARGRGPRVACAAGHTDRGASRSARGPRGAAAWRGSSRACDSLGGSLANLPLRNVLRTHRAAR